MRHVLRLFLRLFPKKGGTDRKVFRCVPLFACEMKNVYVNNRRIVSDLS